MYSFEAEFICPDSGLKKGFYVYGRSNSNENYVPMPSTDYKPAKNWIYSEEGILVEIYCDKCWKTRRQIFDLNGNPVGECKWGD